MVVGVEPNLAALKFDDRTPRMEKRLPVAGIPGKSPLCMPDMVHST